MNEAGGPLGIFGGTFDPLHIGHLRLAIEAREALGLAEVCFMPAGRPALRDAPRADPAQRLAMVECALAALPACRVDDFEVIAAGNHPALTYTVDSLRHLRATQGAAQPLVLLLGADAFSRLEAWHRWRDLFELAHIGVATRPGHDPRVGAGDTALDAEFRSRRGCAADLAAAPAGRIVSFAITALEISASAIRERLATGLDVRHLVPDSVLDYIESHQLYRTPHGH